MSKGRSGSGIRLGSGLRAMLIESIGHLVLELRALVVSRSGWAAIVRRRQCAESADDCGTVCELSFRLDLAM